MKSFNMQFNPMYNTLDPRFSPNTFYARPHHLYSSPTHHHALCNRVYCFEYRREERAPIHLKKGVDPQAHYHRKVQRCKRVEVKIDNQSKLLLPMTPCAPLLLAPPKIGAIPIATFNLNPFYTADKLSSVAQLLESLRGNCHP